MRKVSKPKWIFDGPIYVRHSLGVDIFEIRLSHFLSEMELFCKHMIGGHLPTTPLPPLPFVLYYVLRKENIKNHTFIQNFHCVQYCFFIFDSLESYTSHIWTRSYMSQIFRNKVSWIILNLKINSFLNVSWRSSDDSNVFFPFFCCKWMWLEYYSFEW